MVLIKRHKDVYYIEGRNLRMHRKTAGLSQRQLAEQLSNLTGLHIDQRRISEKENSFEFEVNENILCALRKIFHLTV